MSLVFVTMFFLVFNVLILVDDVMAGPILSLKILDPCLKLMIDSFSCSPMGAELDFIHIYLKYFPFTSAIMILTSFFRFL